MYLIYIYVLFVCLYAYTHTDADCIVNYICLSFVLVKELSLAS